MIQPDHSHYSNFSDKYYPRRKNGWGDHLLIYNKNIEEKYNEQCFEINPSTGTIVILKDLNNIHFEAWWQGHARKYNYYYLKIH